MLYTSSNVTVKHSHDSVWEVVGNPDNVSRFWKIIKKTETTVNSKVIYQINLGSRSNTNDPKPVSTLINAKSWGKKYPKSLKIDGITWHTVESSVEKFTEFVKNGFAYRLGIKENGNDLKNFVGAQGLAFDLDHDPSTTLEDTQAILKEQNLNGIIHYSPSGNPKNNKFRLIIFFNEFVKDYATLDHLSKCIGSLFPNNADFVHDPARFFYGSILPIPHIDLKTNNFVEINEKYKNLIEMIPLSVPKPDIDTLSLDDEGLTVPQKFGIKFKEWLDTTGETLGEFVIKICENFDLDLHNWGLHDSPGTNLEQWRGLDPIHPEESKTGSSFTVYHADNGTFGYKSDRSGAAGDLIDLWYRLKHHSWNIDGSVRSRINKQAYWQCLREICDFINQPDWSKEFAQDTKKAPTKSSGLKTIEVHSLNKLDGRKRVLTWQDCYILKENKAPVLNVGRCCQFFLQNFEVKYDTYKDVYWIKSPQKIWKRFNQQDLQGKFLGFLERQEELYEEYITDLTNETFKVKCVSWLSHLPDTYQTQDVEPSWDVIPCKNGVFDIETKNLLSYEECQEFLTYKLPYERKATKGIGIRTLRSFLDQFFVDKDAVDDFLLWCAGTIQNRGYKTKQAVSLVGASGSGKSTLCDLVKSLIMPESNYKSKNEFEIVKNIEANKVFSDDGQFNLQPLEHQRLVVLNEFTGFGRNSSQGSNMLKNLVAGDGYGYRINTNVKYSNQDRSFLFRGGIITNSQDYTKFKEDVGINRRLMVIRVNKIKEDQPELFDALRNFEILEDLWNYFLDFDLEDVYDRMRILASSDGKVEWKNKTSTLMNQANNKYWSFLEECIEVIEPEKLKPNDPIPSCSAKTVYDNYVGWCQQQGEHPGTLTAFGKGLTKAIGQLTKRDSEEIKKRTAKGVSYLFCQIKTDIG